MYDYVQLNGRGDIAKATAISIHKSLVAESNAGKLAQTHRLFIGQQLVKMRALLSKREFKDWLSTEFAFSIRTAQRYIALAVPKKTTNVSQSQASGGVKKTREKKPKVDQPVNRVAAYFKTDEEKRAEIRRLMDSLDTESQQVIAQEYAPPAPTVLFAEMQPDSASLKFQVQAADKLDVARLLFDSCDSGDRKSIVNLMKALATQSSGRYSEGFEEFWAVYPPRRRKDKGKAFTAWEKVLKSLVRETPPVSDKTWERHLIRRAAEYAASDVGRGEYVKGPEPWLNGSCWEDDPAAWGGKQDGAMFVSGTETQSGEW